MSININPSLWGPSSWKFLHYVTLSYPDKPEDSDKTKMYNFFMMVKDVLPCEKCTYNFNEHIIKYPLTNDILSSRYTFINWLMNIHNEVNISLGKPTITYDQLTEIYFNQNNVKTTNVNNTNNANNANNTNNMNNSLSSYIQMSTQTMTILLIIISILILMLAIRFKNC